VAGGQLGWVPPHGAGGEKGRPTLVDWSYG
jgi:hypothetical protein